MSSLDDAIDRMAGDAENPQLSRRFEIDTNQYSEMIEEEDAVLQERFWKLGRECAIQHQAAIARGLFGSQDLLDACNAAEEWVRQVRDTAVALNLDTHVLPPRIYAEAQRRSEIPGVTMAEALKQLRHNVQAGRDALDDGPGPAVVAAMESFVVLDEEQ